MRKLLLVVALLVAAAAGFLGYSHWKAQQTPQGYFEQGKKYLDEKKYPEAMIEFMNAIRKDPRHKEGRISVARILAMQGDFSRAAAQWKALLEYYPDDVQASLELARIYLIVGSSSPENVRLAQALVEKVLAKDPNNVDALVLSGAASGRNKDYGSSEETLEKAASLDPKNAAASLELGTVQLLHKNLPEAEKTFIKARDANPTNKSAVLALANYYRSAGDPAKEEAALKDALALDPADRRVYLPAVNFYSKAQRSDDVERVLRGAQAKTPDSPAPSLDLFNFYQSMNRPADARRLLLDLKTKFPNDLDLATALATNLLPDQPERAQREVDQILKANPKSLIGSTLLGEYQFRSGQFDAAEATLSKDPVVKSPFPQVHFFLGKIALRKQQLDPAIDHFQKSLAVNARYLPSRIALAETLMQKGRLADSRLEAQRALQLESGNTQALLLKSSLDLAEKKYPEAEKELLDLAKQHPENAAIQRQLAVYYDALGKTGEEEKSLSQAVELSPNLEDDFGNLILFYLKTKQPDRAFQKLNSVPDAQKQPYHYELLGMTDELAGKPQEAESAYKKALGKEPNRFNTEQLLLNHYLHAGSFDEALKILDGRIKKNAGDSGALSMRARIYQQQGKTQEAKQSYELALQADPNQDFAANDLAYILADEGHDLDKALKWAQAVRNRRPEDPGVADTLGWVYYKLGRFVLARDAAQFAATKQPDDPLFQYHLGMIYRSNSQTAQAETALKKALANPREFKERNQADAALKDIDHWRHLVDPAPATSKKDDSQPNAVQRPSTK